LEEVNSRQGNEHGFRRSLGKTSISWFADVVQLIFTPMAQMLRSAAQETIMSVSDVSPGV